MDWKICQVIQNTKSDPSPFYSVFVLKLRSNTHFLECEGYTLVEILISLLILSLLLSFGVSSFNGTMARNEKALLLDDLTVAVSYAKLQALTHGKSVYLIPNGHPKPDWSLGAKLVSRENHIEKVIHEWRWNNSKWIVSWKGANGIKYIKFSPDPVSAISNGRFQFFNPVSHQKAVLILNRMGRLYEV